MKEFKKRVFYQIYPSSFKDSNNDGFGDINGIISKLDYLKDLGVGGIWLSPIYESPMDDMGYDISDYMKINPRFGTMEDFENLIAEAKKRDILIVMDLVINHTSTEHKWFKEASKGEKDNKYNDYYIIKEVEGKKLPNNWQSCFTGPAWKKIEGSKNRYYLHLYCDNQADLNYHNEEVIKEIENILRFWLDKGVYGFRCDVINNIYKSSLKNDNPMKLYNRGEKFYANQDEMFKILTRIRTEVLDNYDTFLVGETGVLNKEVGNRFLNERCLDMFFEFDHVWCDKHKLVPVFKKKFKPKNLLNPIFKWQEDVPYIANYLENHDQLRSVSRYGDEGKYYKESAKLLALFLLSLKGTPFIYEGEEIGMLNAKNLNMKVTNDVAAIYTFNTVKSILHCSDKKAEKLINETVNRDHARTPMQWNNDVNAGFNEGAKTWLFMNDNYEIINVEKEINDETSILSFYKKMIKFRNNDEVLINGEFLRGEVTNKVSTFYRIYENKQYLIVLNFSKKENKFISPLDLNLLISNYNEFKNDGILPPYFAGIFEVK